ncbi:MAG: cupin domain-containing protein [Fimbriimonadaceae bacterium]|nr:cupin domain-containing protein [Fimbriimonadaceae bacterium]
MNAPNPAWAALVEQLRLEPHPEGGFFRETWKSALRLPGEALPQGRSRNAATAILFLLPADARSSWHRVASDELWLHQAGDPVLLQVADAPGVPGEEFALGRSPCYQVLVPAHRWQTAAPEAGPAGFALVACVVVPGFEFEDFELASRAGPE